MLKTIGFFLGLLFFTHCAFSDTDGVRNALKVRFKIFKDVPRSEAEAIEMNFTKISDCETEHFRGKQYMRYDDPLIIPLFDVNGYIAGLQTGVPTGLDNNYPPKIMQPPFIQDGDLFKLTAYFVDPLLICKRGRSKQQFIRTGTGQDLFIQTGKDPETDILEIDEHMTETKWVQGLCFPQMGYHYFKEVSLDMSCETFFPVALLYYHGELQGFVWSLGAILNSTFVSYEYPEPEFFLELLKEVPTCLNTLRRSTMHVYFKDNADTFTCKAPPAKESPCTSGSAFPVLEKMLIVWFSIFMLIKMTY
jgi:charged multivesicular body protein 7